MAERSRVRNWSEYLLVQTLRLCFLFFPINMNLRSAKAIGWLWAKLMPRVYQRAVDNLTMAFGTERSAEEIRHLALRSMQNFAMTGVELIQSPRLINRHTWHKYLCQCDLQRHLSRHRPRLLR